jgi:hypothetical protein
VVLPFFIPNWCEMTDKKKEKIPTPEIGPFVFPTLLAIFGLWCFYDGWLTSNPDMQDHLLLNRIGSIVLLPWALIDFIRTKRINNKTDRLSSTNNESDKD